MIRHNIKYSVRVTWFLSLLYLFIYGTGTLLTAQELTPPSFSLDAGYVDSDFDLELNHPDEQADIRYTLDGSVPTNESHLYLDGVDFSHYSDQGLMYIQTTPVEANGSGYGWNTPSGTFDSGIVVRARSFKEGFTPSAVVSRTYLNRDTMHQLPVISVSANSEHLFSDSTGIYVPGDIYQANGWNHDDAWGRPDANYHQRGDEWERPGNIELIDTDGGYLSQAIGLRMHGGGSRVVPLKSFRIYARNEYGESHIDYDLFGTGEERYKRLILRNSGQDFYNVPTMFMDAISHDLVEGLSFDTMDFRPFAVYINGEYWGIQNLRERFDRHYLERVYDVEEGEIDLLSNEVNNPAAVDEGSADFYNTVLDSLETNHINDIGGMEFIERHFDVKNLAEYYASQIYFVNIDWPGNNTDFWRYTGPPEGRGSPKDGRFRWMFYDLDFGFAHFGSSNYDQDLFPRILTSDHTDWANHPRSTLMFRSFVNNKEFLNYYLNIQLDLLNTYLKEDRVVDVLDDFRSIYETEIGRHIRRWGYPLTMNHWNNNIRRRVRFAENRPSVLREQLINHFLSSGTITSRTQSITLNVSDAQHGSIKVNSVTISPDTPGVEPNPYPWSGVYLSGIPITLTAIPEPGYTFLNWIVDGETIPGQQIEVNPEWYGNIRANFAATSNPVDLNDDYELLQYWYFHTGVPNDTPLESSTPSYSGTDAGSALLQYEAAVTPYPPSEGTAGIMDRVNDPIDINYHPEANHDLEFDPEEMRGIRARNPSKVNVNGIQKESALVFHLPTTGYEDVVFSFAAHRTSSGQESMIFHYSSNEGEPEWMQDGMPMAFTQISDEYTLYQLDFTGIDDHRNNPDFKIRIRFDGENTTGDDGNTRFNNISLHGVPYTGPKVEDITKSRMEPNFPNPFQDRTTVRYEIYRESAVVAKLYDLAGRLALTFEEGMKEPGFYTLEIDGRYLSSGIYLLRLQAGDASDTQKIMFIK